LARDSTTTIVTLNNADHIKQCRAREIVQKMELVFFVNRCLLGGCGEPRRLPAVQP
jgi:hypothetical protein